MITFVVRRVLYSIPVLLVASFILFCAVRLDVRPRHRTSGSPVTRRRSPASARASASTTPSPSSTASGWATFVAGRLGRELPHQRRGLPHGVAGDGLHDAADRLGRVVLGHRGHRHRCVLGCAPVLGVRLPLHRRLLRRHRRCRRSGSASSPPSSSSSPSRTGCSLDSRPFYFVGLHSAGESGFNLDYLRHLFLPVLTLIGADHRRVDPLPAVGHAGRAQRRLHPHGPGQGRAPPAGDVPARPAQRPDPPRHRDGGRHRPPLRRPHHHRERSSRCRAWAGCSSQSLQVGDVTC